MSAHQRRTVSTEVFFDPALARPTAPASFQGGWGRAAPAEAADQVGESWPREERAGPGTLLEDVPAPADRVARGPAAAQPGSVPVPEHGELLPHRQVGQKALVWWVGAHGGAGESTLAALLPGSAAAGRAWPITAPAWPRVVLVARTSMAGLAAAQRAAASWASGYAADVDLLGLVLVADAPGRLPAGLRDFAQVVAGGAPRTWSLPWVEAWRLGAHPGAVTAPRPVRALIDDVRSLTAR